jgi:hypothetical protein
MPDYQDKDPKGFGGDPKRGAAMGRHSYKGDPDYEGVLFLRQVRIDSQGYDINGTYWGTREADQPKLWWYASEDGTIDRMQDGMDFEQAAFLIRQEYPKATVQPTPPDDGCFADFFEAYLDYAVESPVDEDSLGDVTSADFDVKCKEALRVEARRFFDAYATLFDGEYARAGEVFWLTRSGVGIDFSEDWEGPAIAQLNEAAEQYGQVHLYVHDSYIYASGYENGPETAQQQNDRERDGMLRSVGGFIPTDKKP